MQDTGTRLELSCTSYGCAQIGQLVTCAEIRNRHVARGCLLLVGGCGSNLLQTVGVHSGGPNQGANPKPDELLSRRTSLI